MWKKLRGRPGSLYRSRITRMEQCKPSTASYVAVLSMRGGGCNNHGKVFLVQVHSVHLGCLYNPGFLQMTNKPNLLAAVLAASTIWISPTWAADEGVTPYRPTLANPAELPVPGQLELEFGGLHEKKGQARGDSLPYLLKLGFSREWGVLLGGDAYLWRRDEQGQRERGAGDMQVFLKRAYTVNDDTAFGLELGVNMPTAKNALGSGKASYTLNGIYSRDIGSLRLDVNVAASRIGAPELGSGRLETAFAAGLSVPLYLN